MSTNRIKGLRNNSRSPGSISNSEHHDVTGSHKGIDGQPLVIEEIVTPNVNPEPIRNHGMVRVFNADAGVQYIWSGKEGEVPGTVDATTGMALAPGQAEMFFVGYSADDQKSLMIKTSSAAVQVVIIPVGVEG